MHVSKFAEYDMSLWNNNTWILELELMFTTHVYNSCFFKYSQFVRACLAISTICCFFWKQGWQLSSESELKQQTLCNSIDG